MYAVGVFIDLKKHSLITYYYVKMEFLGIRGVACKWLTSYLANKKQVVSIDVVCPKVRSQDPSYLLRTRMICATYINS